MLGLSWLFILKCFYLMLPAYFANMAPVIMRKISFLGYPVDFNRNLIGKPVFGRHKTFRGLFFGILFAVVIAYMQFLLSGMGFFSGISLLDYSRWAFIGFLMGFGALLGDLAKSFIKRRIGIKPGNKFIPFDQTDFVAGSLIFTMMFFDLGWEVFVTSLILSFVLHIIVNHVAFWLKIRNESW
jgi:CDP-2,3-bis-(O-geranylgeranyl)-sn-glycerol synthase